jgi:hypothetical protein
MADVCCVLVCSVIIPCNLYSFIRTLGLASLDLQSWRMILIVGAGSFVLTLVGMFVKKLLIR